MPLSTQDAIDIAGIKDGIIIMRDRSYRVILQVVASNFALKSEQEQSSIIFQYQSFLNSLHFPIEVVIRSRRLELAPYLKKIGDIATKQQNELIKMQATDYVDFVSKLITLANIMKKSFYAVISYVPLGAAIKTGFFDQLTGKNLQNFDHIKISDEEYKDNVQKLMERANIVAAGLGTMGLHCFQLSTEEIVELFYQIYNPDDSAKERVADAELLSSSVILSEKEKVLVGDEAATPPVEKAEETSLIDNSSIVKAKQKAEAERAQQAAGEAAPAGVPEAAAAPATTVAPTGTAAPAAATPTPEAPPAVTATPAAPAVPAAAPEPAPAAPIEPPKQAEE